ncbi:MAG: RsmD family RNA methyltransferase [Algisphaera sp.]
MRIIAGTHRGRNYLGPEGDEVTRPITDRVKENLFNRLHSLGVLGYGKVLDVFAGTGSMGMEALSRGAEHCTFVERDRSGVDRLQENLDTFGFGPDQAVVRASDALGGVWMLPLDDGSITLAFLDPPYPLTSESLEPFEALLVELLPKMEPGGVVLLRTAEDVVAKDVAGYDGMARIVDGTMGLHFYQAPLSE